MGQSLYSNIGSGVRAELDTDGDGMPDSYEIAQGFEYDNPADGQGDADNDNFKNVDEYRTGTDPHDAASKRALAVVAVSSTQCTLRFTAVANKGYTIQYRDSLSPGSWQLLVEVPVEGTTHTFTYNDSLPPGLGARFYQVVLSGQ